MDRDPLCIQLVRGPADNTEFILHTAPWKHGEVATIEEISVYNDTRADGVIDVGLYDGNSHIWLQTLIIGAHSRWHNFELTFTMLTDYQIAIRFNGHAAGDILRANIVGYIRAPYTTP